jgi:anti-sigma factor RsiW
MSENYRCGDPEGLIAFVYGECEPVESEAVAAHIAGCPSCAEEIESLRSTRTMLAAWTPPQTSLGFRITPASDRSETPVLRPAAWWRQPLPAWAQVAAAVLIFAAGMTAGGAWQQPVSGGSQVATIAPSPATPVARSADAVPVVSRDELRRLEQRLLAVETTRSQAPVRPATVVADEAAVMRRVETILAESEQRQRTETAQLVEAVARNMSAQRQVDLQQIDRWVGQMYSATDATLRQHNTAINSLVRVSLPQSTAR